MTVVKTVFFCMITLRNPFPLRGRRGCKCKQLKLYIMRIQNARTTINKRTQGVKMSRESKTVPDMALTVTEIMTRYLRPSNQNIDGYDETGIMSRYNNLSRVERERMLQHHNNEVERLSKEIEQEIVEFESVKKSEEEDKLNMTMNELNQLKNEQSQKTKDTK